jgi:CRISPR-associated protein (TIGR02584 family)
MARRVPIAVCLGGLSPAVVTETLYALAITGSPRVVPREVHVITTHSAYGDLAAALLGPAGAIARLKAQQGLPASSLQCTSAHIHVMGAPDGPPIDDIRDERESEIAGEFIGSVVRRLTDAADTELHCSLAGGRKTMSALLATALQLHGRPQDRLYHVLVNDPFERVPSFFFPPRPPVRYRVGGRIVDSRKARVSLVEIPLVRLGAVARLLGVPDLDITRTARELQAEALGRMVPDRVVVSLARHCVSVGADDIALEPQEVALYALYAASRAACRVPACKAGGRCSRCCLSDDEVHDRRAEIARRYAEARGGERATGLAHLLAAADHDAQQLAAFRAWLQQTRSRLNRRLAAVLGRGPVGRRYLVTEADLGRTGDKRRRGLLLPPGFIDVRA